MVGRPSEHESLRTSKGGVFQFSILKTQRMCFQGRGGGSLDTTLGKSQSKERHCIKWGHRPVPLPAAA